MEKKEHEIHVAGNILRGYWDGRVYVIEDFDLNEISYVSIPDDMTLEEARQKYGITPEWEDDGN